MPTQKTPLLEAGEQNSAQRPTWRALWREAWALAWPAMTRQLLACTADRFSLAMVGHWDPSKANYDGAGLGKMWSNITGLSIGLGLNLGLGTLCSQSFGAGRSHLDNGLHLRRCVIILVPALLFACLAAGFGEPILRAMHQPPAVAAASATYAQMQVFGVPFGWLTAALSTVCDGLQQTRPGMYAQAARAVTSLALCAVMVHPRGLGWGYLGMAASGSLANAVSLAVVWAWIRKSGVSGSVWGRHPSTAHERAFDLGALRQYAAVALPAAVLWWLEWWSFEGLSVLVGVLPDPTTALAAWGTEFNITVIFYQVFSALGVVMCVMIGKYIGAGRAAEARRIMVVGLTLAAAFVGLVASTMYFLRRYIALAFVNDAAIVDEIADTMLGPCLSVPGYALLMNLYGAARGANIQARVTWGTLVGYGGGIPLAWYLGTRAQWPSPLLGVWLGNAAALAFAALWAAAVALSFDWSAAKPVKARAQVPDLQGEGGNLVSPVHSDAFAAFKEQE